MSIESGIAAVGLRSHVLALARAIEVSDVELQIRALPAEFDGYRILHISDLHVGRVPGIVDLAAEKVSQLKVDLAVLTGDIQTFGTPRAADAVEQIEPLLQAIRAEDGIVGVLGNHDTHDMVEALERRGVRMLVNEHERICRPHAQIHLTGIDDVHFFYTEDAMRALRPRQGGCAVALVHSPEMADIAADAGYALYLSGHTHGGQICLRSGRALYSALDCHKHLASGGWTYGQMAGYTSRGLGAAVPVRVNCPPEITVIRLRRSAQATSP